MNIRNKELENLRIPTSGPKPLQSELNQPTPEEKNGRSQQARINGAKSKGPITEEGKNICSRSALLHGLTAKKHSVLDVEDDAEFLAFRAATVDHFRPSSLLVLALVENLASINWRKDRLILIETAYFNHQISEELGEDPLEQAAQGTDAIAALLRSWIKSSGSGGPVELLRRYIATLTHEFNTTLSNILKLEKRDQQRRHDPKLEMPYAEPQPPITKRSQETPAPAPIDIATKRPNPKENRR